MVPLPCMLQFTAQLLLASILLACIEAKLLYVSILGIYLTSSATILNVLQFPSLSTIIIHLQEHEVTTIGNELLYIIIDMKYKNII